MRKYWIYAPPYSQLSAGIKALYMLRDALMEAGQIAEIVPMAILPFPSIENDDIVIYPEIVGGNPLNARNVVRWLLYYHGRYRNTGHYPGTDMIYGYTKRIAKHYGTDKILFLPTVDDSLFVPPSVDNKREGYCFYANKYRKFYRKVPQDCGIEITNPGQSREEIIRLLQGSEALFIYEDTALGTEALLCGCPVVCVPNENFTENAAAEELFCGVAWGIEELSKAKVTVAQARGQYARLKEQFKDQLQEFIRETSKP